MQLVSAMSLRGSQAAPAAGWAGLDGAEAQRARMVGHLGNSPQVGQAQVAERLAHLALLLQRAACKLEMGLLKAPLSSWRHRGWPPPQVHK